MEAHDIKETWKAGVEKNIKPYPEDKLNEMVVKSGNRLPTRCGRRGCLPYCNAVYKRAKHGKSVRGYSRFGRIVRFLFPLGTFRLQNAEIHQRHGCKGMVGIPDKRS